MLYKHRYTKKVFSVYFRAIKYKKKKHNLITVKDSFNFASGIVEQDSSSFMGSLDIDSLLTSIPLEETIEICTNNLFKNNNIAHGVKKVNLKIFYL